MRYAIGLDVGIESVGYSVLELNSYDTPRRIESLGVRIFDRAEHPKDGSSLAAPRREARGARRRLRRHRHRLERIRGLIISSEILTKDGLESLYDGELSDIYELRTRALDELVSAEDFSRILIHLAQRRGYKSNRKSEVSNEESAGKILTAVSANKKLCEEKGYRTIGEMFYRDERFSEYKRNKNDDYSTTIDRQSVEDEARMIFKSQRVKGAKFADEKIETAYLDILLGQRSFAEGPASGPYSGNQIQRMRGMCTFEADEFRAAKASYSFQLFNLWQHINHIRLIRGGETIALNDDERKLIFELAHEVTELNYAKIRKHLKISDEYNFAGIRYEQGKSAEAEKKSKIKDLEVFHKIKKCVTAVSSNGFEELTHEQLDAIGEALSKNMSDDDILKALEEAKICRPISEALLELPNLSKFGHLSVKACRKIIPFLEKGCTYDKACEGAGYNFNSVKKELKVYLPPVSKNDTEITSPVVKRAISQTIKVINAIIRDMSGVSPVYINIELARELSKNYNDRNKIRKSQDENAKKNEELMEQLKEYGGTPGGHDIIKMKLWNEQDGRCMYSGETIEIGRLTEPGYVDVDHIVPYSICFDDRLVNKVLVLSKENRQKGNRLPLQYLQGKKRDDFIVLVNQSHLKSEKKRRLLMEKISDESEWKQRNLQDTQFISSYLRRYIDENLMFAPFYDNRKRHVMAVNGAITSYVRKRWGINKVREDGDLHHAADAVVIGCISQGMVNRISNYTYYKETKDNGDYVINEETGELETRFPTPWKHFTDELNIRLTQNKKSLQKMLFDVNYDSYSDVDIEEIRPLFVSRMPNHKVTGSAHEATVKSGRLEEVGYTVSKVSLTKLKLDKNGEIQGYYNPDSDKLLYEALKKRLLEFDGNGEKAFGNIAFYKPKSDGTQGPLVKKVKVEDVSSNMVKVQQGSGVASNDSMVRCDVFYVENDGYYFVPIYVADTVKAELPNLAPIAGKDSNGQKKKKVMKAEDFMFSLYRNDLIRIYSKSTITVNKVNQKSTLPEKMTVPGEEGLFLYFSGMDVSVAFLSGITHDNTYKHRSIGKTTLCIEKYDVDVLGNVRKIEKEERKDFLNRKR
ncbi:MAG: type II CRISPR RNA-guided endonuclease Cas9 [Ruminococcaceae bacterium]|nr:type II CRISPR RNA-guided endonuclease Cas9 [Oscillospiraceae bacterium]